MESAVLVQHAICLICVSAEIESCYEVSGSGKIVDFGSEDIFGGLALFRPDSLKGKTNGEN